MYMLCIKIQPYVSSKNPKSNSTTFPDFLIPLSHWNSLCIIWGSNSVIKQLPNMHKMLSLSLNIEKQNFLCIKCLGFLNAVLKTHT